MRLNPINPAPELSNNQRQGGCADAFGEPKSFGSRFTVEVKLQQLALRLVAKSIKWSRGTEESVLHFYCMYCTYTRLQRVLTPDCRKSLRESPKVLHILNRILLNLEPKSRVSHQTERRCTSCVACLKFTDARVTPELLLLLFLSANEKLASVLLRLSCNVQIFIKRV